MHHIRHTLKLRAGCAGDDGCSASDERREGEKLSANVGLSGVRARGRLLQVFTLGQIILNSNQEE